VARSDDEKIGSGLLYSKSAKSL
jgi:hypothetical protein